MQDPDPDTAPSHPYPREQFGDVSVLARVILAASSEEKLAEIVLQGGLGLVGAVGGALALAQPDGRALGLVCMRGRVPVDIAAGGWIPIDEPSPLTDTVRTGEAVVLTSGEEVRSRYPDLLAPAEEANALATAPLEPRQGSRGAVCWWFDPSSAARMPVETMPVVRFLSVLAAAQLDHVRSVAGLARRVGQLQHALDSRVAIEQAKGLLAGVLGCTLDEAFDMLRAHARSNQLRLHEVAWAVASSELPARVFAAYRRRR